MAYSRSGFPSLAFLLVASLLPACAVTGAAKGGGAPSAPPGDPLLEAAQDHAALVVRLGPELWAATPHATWMRTLRTATLAFLGVEAAPFLPEAWLDGLPGWDRERPVFIALVPVDQDPEAMLDDLTHDRVSFAPTLRLLVPATDGEVLARGIQTYLVKHPTLLGPPAQTTVTGEGRGVRIETLLPFPGSLHPDGPRGSAARDPARPSPLPAEPTSAYRWFAETPSPFGIYARSWKLDRLLWQRQLGKVIEALANVHPGMKDTYRGWSIAGLLRFLSKTGTGNEIDDVALAWTRWEPLRIRLVGSLSPAGETRWRQVSPPQALPFDRRARVDGLSAFIGVDFEKLAEGCAALPKDRPYLPDEELMFLLPFQFLTVMQSLTCQAEASERGPLAVPPRAMLVAIPDGEPFRMGVAAHFSAQAPRARDERLARVLEDLGREEHARVHLDKSPTGERTAWVGFGVDMADLLSPGPAHQPAGAVALARVSLPYVRRLAAGTIGMELLPPSWRDANRADLRVSVRGATLQADVAVDAPEALAPPILRTWSRAWSPRDLAAAACLTAARAAVAEVFEAFVHLAPEKRASAMAESWSQAEPALACAGKSPANTAAVKHLRGIAGYVRRLVEATPVTSP